MGERARAFLHRVAPHLARGLQSAALIGRALAPADELTRESAPGVVVLDARNRPVLRTEIAAVWLEDLADVGLRMPHGVPLSVLGLAAQLRFARTDIAREVRVRARGRSGRWYTIRASLAEPDASGECTTVVVVRPVVPREMATILTRLYDLSEREREIIAAVARGNSTKRIAALLGVSPHTVTEHIERACQKIGVRGRKALIARLFFDGYAPMLRSGFENASR
jgi:DNA-binding CsgD family transcriptional regulator